MKKVVASVGLELRKGQSSISLKIPALAEVRALAWAAKQRLVMTAGAPEYEDIPVAFIELDADAEKVERTFVLLATNQTFEPREGLTTKWCATAVSFDGSRVAHLFELLGTN